MCSEGINQLSHENLISIDYSNQDKEAVVSRGKCAQVIHSGMSDELSRSKVRS